MSNKVPLDTRDQAQETANKLMDYWGRRGWEVNAWVVPVMGTKQGEGDNIDTFTGWVVRTNLINGMPQEMYHNACRAALAS